MRTNFELADTVHLFGSSLFSTGKLTPLQQKVLGKIASCRTAALGGHEEHCNHCVTVRYSYNSCGDRHCPKCQAAKQALWIDELMQNTLPVKHYHVVFTVPHQLNAVCLHNQRMYYNLLFAAVWNTLRSFGYTHYGVESGAVAVLHIPPCGTGYGGKTSHCTHTSIVLFRQPDIPLMAGGSILVIQENTCIRFVSLAMPLKGSFWTASNVPCENKTSCRYSMTKYS